MKPDFIQVTTSQFCDVWTRIKNKVDAMESNLVEVKLGARPLIIEWGYKDETTGEKVILAVSQGDDDGDQYWVAPSCLESKAT